MKKTVFVLVAFVFSNLLIAQDFEKYFAEGSLRVDYYHGGNDSEEFISNDALYHEPFWGGSKINLLDTFNYGHYKFEVFDSASNTMIYSKGYSTLFGEWRYTAEAKTNWRTLSECNYAFPEEPD